MIIFLNDKKKKKKIFIEKIENELNNLKVFENWEIGENNQ